MNEFAEPANFDLSKIRGIDEQPLVHQDYKTEIRYLRDEITRLALPIELSGMFTVRRLLELDAAVYTYLICNRKLWRHEAAVHLEDLVPFYSIAHLPQEYTETLFFIMGELNAFWDGEIEDDDRINALILTVRLLVFLSLCYPDPVTMQQRGLTHVDCLPGIRLIRMLRALANAWGEHSPASAEFERRLYQETRLDYPILGEYANGWVAFFDTLYQADHFPEYSKVRSEVMTKRFLRLSGKSRDWSYLMAMGGEPLHFLTESSLRIYCNNTDGTPSPVLLLNKSLVDDGYNIDRIRHVNAWRLAEYFRGKAQKFHCALAGSGACGVERAICRVGFQTPVEFPRDAECRVSATVRDTSHNVLRI